MIEFLIGVAVGFLLGWYLRHTKDPSKGAKLRMDVTEKDKK